MINLLFRNAARFSLKFKLENYSYEDYATMCGLLKTKYQLHNQEIQTSGIIKLLDDANKVMGVYNASEARKKAQSQGMDMVLVSQTSKPMLCRATDFRLRTINRFYQEIVIKSLKDFESKATATKSIKIAPTLNKNESIVKLKQITQLSQKYAKVRVFMVAKVSQKEEALQRLEEIKSQLMNRCYIEEEISNRRFDEDEDEGKDTGRKTETYSFVLRAKESNLEKTVAEGKKRDPDQSVENFLRKYYRQEDGDMMDLRSAGKFQVDTGLDLIEEETANTTPAVEVDDLQIQFVEEQEDPRTKREAEARVLNRRLKVLLSLNL